MECRSAGNFQKKDLLQDRMCWQVTQLWNHWLDAVCYAQKRWGRNGINANYHRNLRNTRWKCDLTLTEVTIAMKVNGNKDHRIEKSMGTWRSYQGIKNIWTAVNAEFNQSLIPTSPCRLKDRTGPLLKHPQYVSELMVVKCNLHLSTFKHSPKD
jgi:hypothetical protein